MTLTLPIKLLIIATLTAAIILIYYSKDTVAKPVVSSPIPAIEYIDPIKTNEPTEIKLPMNRAGSTAVVEIKKPTVETVATNTTLAEIKPPIVAVNPVKEIPKSTSYVPEKAFKYFDIINKETDLYFKEVPNRAYVAALIEHESCITLKHSRCWEPTSRLKSAREEGAGLGQLTRTWTTDGEIRFDSLKDMARLHKSELKDLSWETIYSRPDLQIRALILMSRDNYKSLHVIEDPTIRLHMADAAYNGGLGGVRKDRRLCGLKQNCDPQIWFGHVEHTCSKSTTPIYGTRSPCFINRHHVKDVFNYRLPKYEPHFK